MLQLTDIHALTGFVRDPKSHLERLTETGRPEVLTVNGEARVVVQDVSSYQKLLDDAEDAKTYRALRDSIAAVERGEPGIPAEQVFEEMRAIINDEPR